jgi:pimeloyl-ACP methyl ester carboxylesterase
MEFVTSADGTRIATHTSGTGSAMVIVNGALSTAKDAAGLAEAFAAAGLRAVTYDRRARGDSGDALPAEPEREVDDLAAVIDAAGGAAVIGHSSGAVLALYAAGEGVPMTHLFLSEPPFRFGENPHATDLAERLQAMVDDGHHADAVVTFQREAVGLPEPFIEQFRSSPEFEHIIPLAQSTVYDTKVTERTSIPSPAMLGAVVPVTILCGADTMPFLAASARRLASMMPDAEFVEVRESAAHRVDPHATARLVAERLS